MVTAFKILVLSLIRSKLEWIICLGRILACKPVAWKDVLGSENKAEAHILTAVRNTKILMVAVRVRQRIATHRCVF